MTLDSDRRNFFSSWGIGSLPLCTLPLRFRAVLVDPCFITRDDRAQNVILPLQKVLVYGTKRVSSVLCFLLLRPWTDEQHTQQQTPGLVSMLVHPSENLRGFVQRGEFLVPYCLILIDLWSWCTPRYTYITQHGVQLGVVMMEVLRLSEIYGL